LLNDDFWRVQHQITAAAYLVRDDSCGIPLYPVPAGGLPRTARVQGWNYTKFSNKSQEQTGHKGTKAVWGACHDCRWIFHAARGFFCHNCSHFAFSQTTRKANIADEPVLFHIIPDCLSRLPTTCLHAPSTAPEPIS